MPPPREELIRLGRSRARAARRRGAGDRVVGTAAGGRGARRLGHRAADRGAGGAARRPRRRSVDHGPERGRAGRARRRPRPPTPRSTASRATRGRCPSRRTGGRTTAGIPPCSRSTRPRWPTSSPAPRATGSRWNGGRARRGWRSARRAGSDAFEQRSFAAAEVEAPGRPVAAAVGPARRRRGGTRGRGARRLPRGIARRRPSRASGPSSSGRSPWRRCSSCSSRSSTAPDGLIAARRGARIVAPAINLSDSPRFPGTLPRTYDAEGVPRRPVPLIQDGVAHHVVADSGHRRLDRPRDPPRARRAVARPPRADRAAGPRASTSWSPRSSSPSSSPPSCPPATAGCSTARG